MSYIVERTMEAHNRALQDMIVKTERMAAYVRARDLAVRNAAIAAELAERAAMWGMEP